MNTAFDYQPPIKAHTLIARPMGIDTYQEPVIYMHSDCHVCRSEGFESQSRVQITAQGKHIIATLNVVSADYLAPNEAGLSDAAWRLLEAETPIEIELSHPEPVDSFTHVRAKLFDNSLTAYQFESIFEDISKHRYSDVQLSAFLAACSGKGMSLEEIVDMTRSMVMVGEKIDWGVTKVFDKHCVGGLPGNRTTPIVVAIVAASGLVMPKTSSRAITSPSGTADTMETLAPVDITLPKMRQVVEQEGGCIVWGGSVNLSPADDILIRIERALDIDSEAQLVASILSKKIAAGSTNSLIDIPVGTTAKVRDVDGAKKLSKILRHVGGNLGMSIEIVITDGSQPIGRGVGPALEAKDVLAVLQCNPDAPSDLTTRATFLAGIILEQSKHTHIGDGQRLAYEILIDGRAWTKFQAICDAQGGMRTPPTASQQHVVVAARRGRINAIDNRRLSKVAKLAGAPISPAAGLENHVKLGDHVEVGDPLFTLYAEAHGELNYALSYIEQHRGIMNITKDED